MVNEPTFIEAALAATGTTSDIDFSQYNLDEPLPGRLTTNGEQGSLDRFQQWGSGKTLRQLASERFDNELDLIGTPDEVADKIAAAMGFVGGDGFLISTPFQRTSRRYIKRCARGWYRHCNAAVWYARRTRDRRCGKHCGNSEQKQRDYGHDKGACGRGTDRGRCAVRPAGIGRHAEIWQ
jgi:hypothetical protein